MPQKADRESFLPYLPGKTRTESLLAHVILFVYTKTYAVCLGNLTSQNVREVARVTTANITRSSFA
jgi:hypothetical protein